jgi:hypothetical protein
MAFGCLDSEDAAQTNSEESFFSHVYQEFLKAGNCL